MAYLRPQSSVVFEKFDEETVVVHLESGQYYNLEGTADAIWTLAVSGLAADDIVGNLHAHYQGDRDAIGSAAARFLEELVAEGLLVRVENVTPPQSVPTLPGGAFRPPALQRFTDMEEALRLDPIHDVDQLGWPMPKPRAV